MIKRQNIFQDQHVKHGVEGIQGEHGLTATAQIEFQQLYQFDKNTPSQNREEVSKDLVRPSLQPSIRCYTKPNEHINKQHQILPKQITNGTGFQGIFKSQDQEIESRQSIKPGMKLYSQGDSFQQSFALNKNLQRNCPSHSDDILKRICSIPNCSRDILLCGDCMYKDPDHTKIHQSKIILVNEFLDIVERESHKQNWKTLLDSKKSVFSPDTQSLALFPEKYANQYGEYIEFQKSKIKNDLADISQLFGAHLKQVENSLIELLNCQLQYVCEQLENLKSQVKKGLEIDERFKTNPRGYLENQLSMNEDMNEVSGYFREIRDLLFGGDLKMTEEVKSLYQIQEKAAQQLKILLSNPPQYSCLTKEILDDLDRKIVPIINNLQSDMAMSLSNDPKTLSQTVETTNSRMSPLKRNALKENGKGNFVSFGNSPLVSYNKQPNTSNQLIDQQSMHHSVLAQVNSNANINSKEYLVNYLLANSVKDSPHIQPPITQNLQKSNGTANLEYDYSKNKQKLQFDYIEEKPKRSLPPQNVNFSSSNYKIENFSNETSPVSDMHSNKSSEIALPITNYQNQASLHYPRTQLLSQLIDNSNIIANPTRAAEEISIPSTPLKNTTPLKRFKDNISLNNQQSNILNVPSQNVVESQMNEIIAQKYYHSKQKSPLSYQHQAQESNQQMNLDTIPELNNSSSRASLGQVLSQSSVGDCEIMEGSKVAKVKSIEGMSLLSQATMELSLGKDRVNCLCVVNGMLIACGTSKGIIKVYNLESKICVAEHSAHKSSISGIFPFQNEQPFIVSGSVGDGFISLWNIIEDKQSVILSDPKATQGINLLASLYDERNIVTVSNNFTSLLLWDVKEKKKVHTIVNTDPLNSPITCILTMGPFLSSILVGYKNAKVSIYRIEYLHKAKNSDTSVKQTPLADYNKISQIDMIKSIDLGVNNVPTNMISLFNEKVFVTVKNNILIWDTKTFELVNQIDSYQNDNQPIEVCDFLVVQSSEIPQKYSIIQSSKNDDRIVLHQSNSSQSMKYHIKDFQILDSIYRDKLQLCHNHLNHLFFIALNQNKNAINYWKLFDIQ